MATDLDPNNRALPTARATHEPSPDGLGHSVGVPNAVHTPGPWVPCDTDSEHTTLISGNDGSGATRNGGIYIARVQGPDNRANARVIAAAPELLAKLNEVLDFYDALPSEHAPGEVELLDSITALIAKAKAPSRA